MSKVTRVLASALFAALLVALPGSAGAQTADGFCLSNSDLTTDLLVGSRGEDVIDLQIALLNDGQKTVTTGYFGTQTQAAVAAFQTKHGISPAAGYVGPLTRTKLKELYGCGDSTTPRGTIMATVEGTSAFASDGGTITVPPTTNPYTGTLLSIAWSGKNVSACAVSNTSGQFFGGNGVTGSRTWGPKQSTTLQLRCFTDPDGSAVLTKTVNIVIGQVGTETPPVTPTSEPTGTLLVTPTSLPAEGGYVAVNWSASNVGACAVYGRSDGSTSYTFYRSGVSGSASDNVTKNKTYSLECVKDGVTVLTKTATATLGTEAAPLRITSTSPLPQATAGTPYSYTFTSSGGSGTRTWGVSSRTPLPAGLGLSTSCTGTTCVLSGTPTTAGSYTFTINLNAGSQGIGKSFTLVVGEGSATPATPTGSISLIAAGVTGRSVSIASGSTVSISWSAANVDSCAVYGRSEGSTSYRFYRTGTSGTNQTDTPTKTTTYSLECFKNGTQVLDEEATATVNTTSTTLRITSTSPLPQATAGTPYSYTFTSSGGSGTRTWGVSSRTPLPAGLGLSTSCTGTTCVLSGTPTTAGSYTFTINLNAGSQGIGKSFTLVVGEGSATSVAAGNINVTVPGITPVASVDGTQTPVSVQSGTQISVAWSATGADSCAVYGGTNFYATGLVGTRTDSPTRATSYRLECFKGGAQVLSRSVTVNILASAEVMGTLDYNNDHKLDQVDAQFLADVAARLRSCPSGKTCDVTKDGRVSSSDSLALWRYIGTSSTSGLYDYNNDLKIDSLDVARLSGVAAGTASCPTGKTCNVDADSAGRVDAADVTTLKGYIGSPATSGSVLGANTGSSVCYVPATRDLTIGSTGADVTNLQEVLTRDGENVPSTGYFGKQTKSAVIKFQQKYGVQPASGYVGPLTRTQLTTLYDCSLEEPVVEEAKGGKKGGGSGGSGGGGVPTNYGYGYLTDGTYITFILKNGVYTVQTPTSLAGRIVTKNADGTYTLK